ncbi:MULTISPECIES: hypothetical protein [Idiomarina]|jgi:hypothetical protein|uniref:hypothetical protein n=1 Tax=Idiomarina TaxID=135575 RepID=UPI00129A43AC|nr:MULTISPECIES: hypothetical protein [Idiomarina]MRJ41189.1 hypothetical protein [Idiomarina sp. FeN1]NCU56354.1 hypothetical protein [Idiomarina sp. FenA--70]NCU59373.1 hypothetical protein [Idiomarina sp. FenBw--71]UUN12548.1 hypothetical protein KGF88_07720 [Idiomarina loihiensis]
MQLTEDRNTARSELTVVQDPVAAAVRIFAGGITMLNAAGDAVPGSTATGLTPRGIAQEHVDNRAGAAGVATVLSRRGCHKVANDGTITRADIGGLAYVVDDQTVANSDGAATRSALGKIIDVNADGVWVDIA